MSKKMILFKTSDGKDFEVEEAVAEQFQAIKDMFDDISAVTSIPLNNITSETFAKVIEYCMRHAETSSDSDDLKLFDANFVNVDYPILFDLVLAANYLNVKGMLDLTCETVAIMLKGKTPDEIRATFNIQEEEEAMRT